MPCLTKLMSSSDSATPKTPKNMFYMTKKMLKSYIFYVKDAIFDKFYSLEITKKLINNMLQNIGGD